MTGPKTAATSRKPFVFLVLASTTKQRMKGGNSLEHPMMDRLRERDRGSMVIGAPIYSRE
jgi:hypothetical protein